MKIHGTITDGMFSNARELYRQFKRLEGTQVTITVAKRKSPRTTQQNSYLWGVVYGTLSDYTGYSPEEIHYQIEPVMALRATTDDNGYRYIKKTSEMSADEFSAYIEAVKLWCWHELNLYIPDPI